MKPKQTFAAIFSLATISVFAPEAKLFADDATRQTTAVKEVDLAEYKTTKTAKRADPKTFASKSDATTAKKTGYLGLSLDNNGVVELIEADSPAEKIGIRLGDQIVSINDSKILNRTEFREKMRTFFAGDDVTIQVKRAKQDFRFTTKLKALSSPFQVTNNRVVIGVQLGDAKDDGISLNRVTENGPAEKAGLKSGDLLIKVDNQPVTNQIQLQTILSQHQAGQSLPVLYRRDGKDAEASVKLVADETPNVFDARNRGWDDRLPQIWKNNVYKLAVIGVEYNDTKRNPKITNDDWTNSLFSLAKYNDKNATGQKVFGSMTDYYQEISYGALKVEGKFVGWVELPKKRMEYSTGNGSSRTEKQAFFKEVLDAYTAKNGEDSLKDYDGIFFLYAGNRVNTTRGSLYWPHRSTVSYKNKRWPYFIVQEGGERMNDISVFCHEFGHMLGLPDLYAQPEKPGMEGVGRWCAMSNQNGQGRPQHFSVWCKEQMGWIKPVMIDPREKQKLVLSPVQSGNEEFFKIPIRPDGSEYLLLENRQRKGFDSDLPADGLLIWRVLPGNSTQRVFLEEAHGVEGVGGPSLFPGAVPFPSPANQSFTTMTTPSSRSQLGGGYDVNITNIRRLKDGKIIFNIGYEVN